MAGDRLAATLVALARDGEIALAAMTDELEQTDMLAAMIDELEQTDMLAAIGAELEAAYLAAQLNQAESDGVFTAIPGSSGGCRAEFPGIDNQVKPE